MVSTLDPRDAMSPGAARAIADLSLSGADLLQSCHTLLNSTGVRDGTS